jgi:xanthine dehydrogenase accessory factor
VPDSLLGELPAGTHVFIMTHDHAEDFLLCDAALRRGDLGSVGLIGSRAKWSRFRQKLHAEGHDHDAINRISCPIGLPDLAGKDPAVIAISVAAGLLQTLARQRAG